VCVVRDSAITALGGGRMAFLTGFGVMPIRATVVCAGLDGTDGGILFCHFILHFLCSALCSPEHIDTIPQYHERVKGLINSFLGS
jgi:hypothetical protein